MRDVNRAIRICQIDPIINVVPRSDDPADVRAAEEYRQSQFAAWDMITGRTEADLGGSDDLVDIIGVNYYIHNQFVWQGSMIVPSDRRYRHVSTMLQEVYERYRRPLFVAETGIEDDTRPAWFRYMCKEVFSALAAGVPVEGICLYPIVNHPGWDDDRHCHNGLFDYAGANGQRPVYEPLAHEVARQSANATNLIAARATVAQMEALDTSAWTGPRMSCRSAATRAARRNDRIRSRAPLPPARNRPHHRLHERRRRQRRVERDRVDRFFQFAELAVDQCLAGEVAVPGCQSQPHQFA